jgi:hypothetical protein
VKAVEDTWLDVLKGYSSLTYLDLSNSYRITDTYAPPHTHHRTRTGWG